MVRFAYLDDGDPKDVNVAARDAGLTADVLGSVSAVPLARILRSCSTIARSRHLVGSACIVLARSGRPIT